MTNRSNDFRFESEFHCQIRSKANHIFIQCVCVSILVCVSISVFGYIDMHCVWKPQVDIEYSYSIISTLFIIIIIETESLAGSLGSLLQLDGLAWQTPGSSHSCLTSTGITGTCHFVWPFTWVLRRSDLRSSPVQSTVLTEPSPWPLSCVVLTLLVYCVYAHATALMGSPGTTWRVSFLFLSCGSQGVNSGSAASALQIIL